MWKSKERKLICRVWKIGWPTLEKTNFSNKNSNTNRNSKQVATFTDASQHYIEKPHFGVTSKQKLKTKRWNTLKEIKKQEILKYISWLKKKQVKLPFSM